MKKIKSKIINFKLYQLIIIVLAVSFIIGGGASFWIARSFFDNVVGNLITDSSIPHPQINNEVKVGAKSFYQQPDFSPQVASIYKKKQAISPTNFLDQLYFEEELLGAGMILTSDGWLVSHGGVIDKYAKDDLAVFFAGQVYETEEIVRDSMSGIVFIKIDAQNLPVNILSKALSVESNEQVFVASQGELIINYIEKANYFFPNSAEELVRSSERYYNFILLQQPLRDELIGAPVFNYAGEVIGILTGNNSNRVAVPITNFSDLISGVLKEGEITRPYLGVNFIDLSNSVGVKKDGDIYNIRGIEAIGLAGAFLYASPALSEAIEVDSPAERAELQPKDLVVKVEETAVNEFNDLTSLIQEYSPGEKIKLTVRRAGEEDLVIEVELVELTY